MCRRVKAGIAVIVVCAILLVGCSNRPAATTTSQVTGTSRPTAATTTTPAKSGPSGELRIATATLGTELFNPVTAVGGSGYRMLGPMGDYLFLMDTRGGAQLPGVVEKWEMAPDGLSYTFSVRKGIKFHNGDELTGKDVKFTIEQYKRPDAYYADTRTAVDRVDLVDEYTVRVVTKGKQPLLLRAMSLMSPYQGLVLPKDYVEKNGWDYFEQHPIGSGPFKFVSHAPGDSIIYEANAVYRGQVPAFKTFMLVLMPEEATQVAALKSGQIDATDTLGPQPIQDLAAQGYQTIAVELGASMVQFHGTYDTRSKGMPTNDLKVRQALSMAINRDEIIKTFYAGKATFPLPPYFSGGSEDMDADYWLNYDKNIYRYDPAAASQLLKEAGYSNGFSIKFYTFDEPSAPKNPEMAQIVQGYWSRIGVKAELVPIDGGTYRSWKNKPVADQLIGHASTFGARSLPPANMKSHFYGKSGSFFLANAFPEVDKLIDDVYGESDAAKRKDMLAKVIKTVADSYAVLPIANFGSSVAIGKKVTVEFKAPPPANSFLSIHASAFRHAK